MFSPTLEKIYKAISLYLNAGDKLLYGIKVRYFVKRSKLEDKLLDGFTDIIVDAAGSIAAEASASTVQKRGMDGLIGLTDNSIILLTWTAFSNLIKPKSAHFIPFVNIVKFEHKPAEKGIKGWFGEEKMIVNYRDKEKIRELTIVIEPYPEGNEGEAQKIAFVLQNINNQDFPSVSTRNHKQKYIQSDVSTKQANQQITKPQKKLDNPFIVVAAIVLGVGIGGKVGQALIGDWGIVIGMIVGMIAFLYLANSIFGK